MRASRASSCLPDKHLPLARCRTALGIELSAERGRDGSAARELGTEILTLQLTEEAGKDLGRFLRFAGKGEALHQAR